MLCLSHGTQDLYPDFLKSLGALTSRTVAGVRVLYGIPILYNIAAMLGALCFGALSEKIGRRYSILFALMFCLLSIPAWAFGRTVLELAIGSCLMQAGGQGAFGVIPAHLNELSPTALRGIFPGFVYQLGVLIASPSTIAELRMRDLFGYRFALSGFSAAVIITLLFLFFYGPEERAKNFQH